MKVNFDAVITDLKGEAIKRGEAAMTLKDVAIDAMLATSQEDAKLPGDEKFRRFELALKCDGADAELKVEDVALLKKRIGETWGTLIVGRAWALLDGS